MIYQSGEGASWSVSTGVEQLKPGTDVDAIAAWLEMLGKSMPIDDTISVNFYFAILNKLVSFDLGEWAKRMNQWCLQWLLVSVDDTEQDTWKVGSCCVHWGI